MTLENIEFLKEKANLHLQRAEEEGLVEHYALAASFFQKADKVAEEVQPGQRDRSSLYQAARANLLVGRYFQARGQDENARPYLDRCVQQARVVRQTDYFRKGVASKILIEGICRMFEPTVYLREYWDYPQVAEALRMN